MSYAIVRTRKLIDGEFLAVGTIPIYPLSTNPADITGMALMGNISETAYGMSTEDIINAVDQYGDLYISVFVDAILPGYIFISYNTSGSRKIPSFSISVEGISGGSASSAFDGRLSSYIFAIYDGWCIPAKYTNGVEGWHDGKPYMIAYKSDNLLISGNTISFPDYIDNPEDIDKLGKTLYIEPSTANVPRGGVEQFKAYVVTGDEKQEITCKWLVSINPNIFDLSAVPGASINDNGVLSVSKSVSVARFSVVADAGAIGVAYANVITDLDPYYDPNSPSGGGGPNSPSAPGGGGGSHGSGESGDGDSDEEDLPDGSAENNYANTGLFTMYACDVGQLSNLGEYLYSDSILDAIGKEIMSFLWNSPIEGCISLHSYPFSLPSAGSSTNAKFGSLELENVQLNRLTDSAMQINWGSVQLKEYWGNFLDYAPHTKVDLYLPWGTGFVSLDPHDCLPGAITIVTNVELSKGTCVHTVSGKAGIIGVYGGKCSTELPLTALDTGGKVLATTVAVGAAAVGAVAAGAGSMAVAANAGNIQQAVNSTTSTMASLGATIPQGVAAGGAVAGAMASAISAPYNAISTVAAGVAVPSAIAAIRTPPSIQRSGSFYSSGAGLGPQTPFVIVSRPEQNVPSSYGAQFGYPSNIYSGLGRGIGYTEVASIHLHGIPATEPELTEIERFLKGGVIL